MLGACESTLNNLINEVRLSFDYFTTEHNFHISKIVLTGGSSMLRGIVGFFEKNLDIPVELWNPVAPLKLAPTISVEELNKNSNRLAVALGLALA